MMGTATLVMMLVGRSIFQKFGWRTAALVTPSMLGATGLAFFALNIFAPAFAPVATAVGTTPLMMAVLVGALQNILSKSSKYSLFDPCKEMAYIPLDQESKTKGKAAIDVVGNPLGKSGGAMIQQILIFAVGSLSAATPVRKTPDCHPFLYTQTHSFTHSFITKNSTWLFCCRL